MYVVKRLSLRFLTPTLLILTSGQAVLAQKLYNERRDKLTQDVKKDFEQLTSGSTNIFEEAIKNVQAQTDADIAELEKRKQILVDSVATEIPFMTWKDFIGLALSARRQALGMGEGEPVVEDLSADAGKVEKEIEELKKEIAEFDQLYSKGAPTIEEFQQTLRGAIDEGKSIDIKNLKDKAKDLTGDLSQLRALVDRLQPQGLRRVALETTLLKLQNELARLNLQQEHRKKRLEALQSYSANLKKYAGDYPATEDCSNPRKPDDWPRFGLFSKLLQSVCEGKVLDHQILTDLQTMAKDAQQLNKDGVAANKKLVDTLIDLSRLMNLIGAARYDLLIGASRLYDDELVFQIRVTQLNMREHEVLLSGGISGLAAFEGGGIKPQDVANIVTAAQAVATAAIAARVK
jgi:hypothetical protein